MTNAWGSNNRADHDTWDASPKRSEAHIQTNAEPAKRASSGAENRSSTTDSRKATKSKGSGMASERSEDGWADKALNRPE